MEQTTNGSWQVSRFAKLFGELIKHMEARFNNIVSDLASLGRKYSVA